MEMITKITPNSTFLFVVPEECKEGMRIDKYIAQQFPLYSRNFFQQLINDELVKLNGQVISKQSSLIKPLDRVTITFPPARKVDEAQILDTLAAKGLDVEIVAENEHFLIVSKPANLLVHRPSTRSTAITLVDWLLAHYKELATIGYVDRPAIIHRLDKDTSGLLIVPRTPYAHSVFGTMFRDRNVKKIYHALIKGNPPAFGSIDLAIGRDPSNKTKMAAFLPHDQKISSKTKGNGLVRIYDEQPNRENKKIRNALTHYCVLEYFNDYALVEITLVTGRMHQIRVHFSAIGHPIIGDPIYGIKSKLIKRQALHAQTISFMFEGKAYSFSKEIPEDFAYLIKLLQNDS